ncbi:unnamed protein product, partial [Polarella glacialis]
SKRAAQLSFAEVVRNSDARKQAHCYFLRPEAEVSEDRLGFGLVAASELKANTLVLVERRLLEVPEFLTPRSSSEVPFCNMGVPLGILPGALFEMFPSLLAALRVSQNSYAPLLMYGLGSVVNHSCRPNTRWVNWPDGLRALLTREEVAAGEELTISYSGSPGQPAWQRQLDLFWRYGFWCRCSACSAQSVAGSHLRRPGFLDSDALRKQVDSELQASGLQALEAVPLEESYKAQLKNLLPLVYLQTFMVALPILGLLTLAAAAFAT